MGEERTGTESRRLVTVLFADLVGSTALGEALDPEVARGLLGRYYELARATMERHGGTVEKFVGDAVMAVFGLPVAHEDDGLRAARAALELRDGLATITERLQRSHGLDLEVRTGLATGIVAAGDAAGEGTTLATGDVVNLAARLQGAAPAGGVLVDEATWRVVRDVATGEALPPLVLKGKAAPVAAWRLLGLRHPTLLRRTDGPFVGRRDEMAALREAFAAVVREGRPRLVTVIAPPGTGKSRLAAELVAGLPPGTPALPGRCLSYGEGITYWPVAEIVRAAAGVLETDDARTARAKLDAVLADVPDGADIADRMAAVIGLDPSGALAGETPWAIRRFLEALAAHRPLVVLVDDLQWAEPALLDLLEDVGGRANAGPILLLCLARPELADHRPGWAKGVLEAVEIHLGPLGDHDTAALLTELAGASLPAGILARIERAAGGNPLFAEQLLAMLVEGGHLERTEGSWVARTEIDRLPIPVTIGALLAARLDALPASERTTILRAAVVGEQFDGAAAAELAGPAVGSAVAACLLALVERELLRPDPSGIVGDDAFRFRHLLVRDAAYDALPKAERAVLHERFAAWLEAAMGDRRAEVEAIVGHHLAEAHAYRALLDPLDPGLPALASRAATRLTAAGRRSMALGDMRGAAEILRRCLGLIAADDPARLELLPDAAKACLEGGDRPRAAALLVEARRLAEQRGDRRIAAVARTHELVIEVWYGAPDCDALRREADDLIAALAELGDDRGLALAWSLVAEIEWYRERASDAAPANREAIRHAERAGDRWMRAEYLALATWDVATVAESIELRRALLEDAGDARRIASARHLSILGSLFAARGDIAEGRRLAAEGLALCEDLGLPIWAGEMAFHASAIEVLAGDLEAADRLLQDGIAAVGGDDHMHGAVLRITRARVLQQMGRLDDAAAFLDEAMPDDGGAARNTTQLVALAVRASHLARCGRLAEAHEMLNRALAWRNDTSIDLEQRLALSPLPAIARALMELGRHEEAAAAARAVLAEADAAGAPAWVARHRAELSAAGVRLPGDRSS